MEDVFLTGGTGLAGSHVAARLRERGVRVRALHRPTSEVRHLAALGCDLVEGNVQSAPDALAEGMVGCDGVVHAASLVYADLPWPRIRAVNVEGTAAVFQAAALAGIRRGVHFSSVAVYGLPEGEVDEEHPTDRPLRPGERYARSKREAERVVWEFARASEMEVVILRPSALYGERDRLVGPRIARHLLRPVQPLLGSGRTPIPLVYAGNVAAAVEAALEAPLEGSPRVFNLATDVPVTQRDLYEGLGRALGRAPRFLPLWAPGARWAARMGDAVGIRLPGMGELSLVRLVRLATRPNPFRSDRIRSELGWTPPVGRDEAIQRTGRWLAEAGKANDETGGAG